MPKETKVLLKQSSSLKEKSLKNQIGFSSDWYPRMFKIMLEKATK